MRDITKLLDLVNKKLRLLGKKAFRHGLLRYGVNAAALGKG